MHQFVLIAGTMFMMRPVVIQVVMKRIALRLYNDQILENRCSMMTEFFRKCSLNSIELAANNFGGKPWFSQIVVPKINPSLQMSMRWY